jgi:hypothetical protein
MKLQAMTIGLCLVAFGPIAVLGTTGASAQNSGKPEPESTYVDAASSTPGSHFDTSIRASLGLLPLTEPLAIQVGPVRMTQREASAYAAYAKASASIKGALVQLKNSPGVIGMEFDPKILSPAIVVRLGTDGTSEPRGIKEIGAAGFQIRYQRTGFSSIEFRAVRDAFARHVFGIKTEGLDIDPDIHPAATALETVDRTDVLVSELLASLNTSGIEVLDVLLPAGVSKIIISVDGKVENDARSLINSDLRQMVDVQAGQRRASIQASGPWPAGSASFSGRLASEAWARGGKQLDNGCTSGPVVRNILTNVDYVLTAGHCYSATGQTATMGGGQVAMTTVAVCDIRVNPNCSPLSYGGVDVTKLAINSGTATGWFIWQAWPSGLAAQTISYTDSTVGSYDLEDGVPLICVEGASPLKFSSIINAASACGIVGGWSVDGFKYLNMYPGQAVCPGDSGSYIRRPTGYGGSWNSGIMSAVGSGEGNTLPNGCWMRSGDASPPVQSFLTTFWKAHIWDNFNTGSSLWPKTW